MPHATPTPLWPAQHPVPNEETAHDDEWSLTVASPYYAPVTFTVVAERIEPQLEDSTLTVKVWTEDGKFYHAGVFRDVSHAILTRVG